MKVVLISRYFPPEIGTAANLFYDLARALADAGHAVTVITGIPWYNLKEVPDKYKGKISMQEEMHGFQVKRLTMPVFGPHKLKLALGHLTAPFSAFLSGMQVTKPDIFFAYSPPLPFGLSGWLLRCVKRAPFVLGVQDLHPQCYIDQGVLKNKFLIKLLEGLERFCYTKSSAITVHSTGNKAHIVQKKGASSEKVKVLPNWIDTEEIKPLPRENEFAREHNLNKRFVVGYAGTLGMSQGLLSVVDAAYLLKKRGDIEFFIVGDGIEKERMIKRAQELDLDNIRFWPMQQKSVYPWLVASSDVGLVTLNAKVQTPVVPSKILSMMAAGRPVLASMPLDGDAPGLIRRAGCGVCVPPEDPEAMAEAIVDLADNPDRRERFAKQGRDFVEQEMSLNRVVADLEQLFAEVKDRA
ncbi:MAG: glycosyltransferase family 4 protein [Desulfohalobiaceae bacterium]|nr:glycosyltransferase family 4 protein [Desulfohalobiaceae bacterium]